MSRKIVIIPSFASSHFLKCWIPNVIEVLNPDIIIINEGLFPNGPENKGQINDDFRKKYCEPIYGKAGFDFQETQDFILSLQTKESPLIVCGIIDYQEQDVNEAFLNCMTTFPANEHFSCIPEYGDIIFTLEPDAFHHEKDIEAINWHLERLKPGEGLKTRWVDFLETQYYTELINLRQLKYRRFAYCFDNMENYKAAINGFMSQSYPKLTQVDDFVTYHYPWFVYDKWKELRYELIYRSDPQYWKDFENGLQEIQINSDRQLNLNRYRDRIKDENLEDLPKVELMQKYTVPRPPDSKILIRPSRQDEGRFARFIDVEHPSAIKNHPNFVK